uniref:Non-structural maintenance of chromosomes element 1 homolog n=1 Tax=Sus scrofa TaxID=9823 RepID=A0A8D0TIJ2_PIG
MQGSTRRAGVMTDVHRRFLQLLMTHGVLEECDIKRLQRHCYKVHDRNAPVEKLEDFINNINSVLESLYIEIKKGVTEDDGRPIYALVNLATTSVSKMASDFAENELDLFRKALELIIDSESGFASSTNILNLVDQLKGKKMRKKEAEQVLQKFVQNKWLIEVPGPTDSPAWLTFWRESSSSLPNHPGSHACLWSQALSGPSSASMPTVTLRGGLEPPGHSCDLVQGAPAGSGRACDPGPQAGGSVHAG